MTSLADLTRGPERAFPTHARLERYYPAAGAEQARSTLVRCIERGEGPTLLVGSPGTGKTMLLQVVAHDVAGSRPVASLTSAQLVTRRALLQSILFELGQPFRQRDEGELRLELIDYLQSANVGERGVVLLVDEAQSLPTRLLEELRVLSNLSIHGDPRLHLVLAGSQALDEKFTSPEVEAFNQRIAARCYLSPFNHHDTAQYVRGHLAAAGADPDHLFTADALHAVYEATGGIARLINQLCDRALLVAAKRQALRVNRELIQGAWADLQQLPTPWNLPDTPEEESTGQRGELVAYGPQGDDQELAAIDETELDESFDPFDEVGHQGLYQPGKRDDRQSLPSARVFAPDDEEELTSDEEELELADESPTEVASSAPELDDRFDTRVDEFDADYRTAQPEALPREASPRAEAEPQTSNPFDETFDDEEIVLDPFASIAAIISKGDAPVSNTFEKEISGLLNRVAHYGPAEPETIARVEQHQSVPEPAPTYAEAEEDLSNSFTIVEAFEGRPSSRRGETHRGTTPSERSADDRHEQEGEVASSATFRFGDDDDRSTDREAEPSDAEIVVVDDDTPRGENPSIAIPTDYRQLFASLRRD